MKYLKKILAFIEKTNQLSRSEGSNPINTLAPKILTDQKDLSRIKPYLNSLKQAIDTVGINNIALTGSYGSGKSTILKTFQHLYPEYKYLNISLASFKDNNDTNEITDSENFERKLEISILQQIFYHVAPSVIPDSRFKRIINLTTSKLFFYTVFLILWILCALILFKFNKVNNLNPDEWSLQYSLDWSTVLPSFIFFLGVGLFVKSVFRLFSNSKISKLNIKGELELGESTDKSIFNQHLEEILYFFERTEFNVVAIEDVDRFNSTNIFTKLREINVLINNSTLIKRRVKFIYAIKDEIFIDKTERVKFFEFIIPVIPFINPSNASDQLAKLLQEENISDLLTADFKSDVVTFIDDIDMRLLINIFNEFLIYRENLSKDLTPDNLFSIIIYKNIFPSDFGDLAKRKGNLYKFFSNRNLYIKDLIDEIDSQIEDINQEIVLLDNESARSVEELRSAYILKLFSKLHKFHSFNIRGEQITVGEALINKNFRAIKAFDSITHWYHNPYNVDSMNSNINFASVEKEISTLTYDQREKLLTDKSNNKINNLKLEKEKLKNRISEIEGLSIKEIFELVNIEKYLGEFKDNYLIRNLLLNGYIDEHYDDYISLFHEVSLTKDDYTFERKIKTGLSFGFDYPITKTESLLKKLPDKYFNRVIILNYNLMEYLLENEDKYKAKCDNIYNLISIDAERQFEFINGFIKRNPKQLSLFVKNLLIYKPTIWQYLNNKSGLPEEEIKNMVKLFFEYGDQDSINDLKEVDTLVTFLEQMEDFFSFTSKFNQIETILSFIIKKKISFEMLDNPSSSTKDLFNQVYENDLYRINEHNITAIVKNHNDNTRINNSAEIRTAHYSTLLKSGLNHLLQYIDNNLEEYITNVLLKIEENNSEHESIVIKILNREDVSTDVKSELVISQLAIINSLDNIVENDIRKILLNNNKVKPYWSNVLDYFDGIGSDDFDEPLIGFLNTKANYLELSKSKLNEDDNKDEAYIKSISLKIIYCDDLNFDSFSFLLKSIPYSYNKLDYDKLATENIKILFSEKMLNLSVENFDGFKERGTDFHIKLVEVHQNKFIEELNEFSLDVSDWILIFKSLTITLQNKMRIIKIFDDTIIVESRQIADIIFSILPINEKIPLRYEVLAAMFKATNSIDKRIALLNLHFNNLADNQVQLLIETLGGQYAKIFQKKHKPVFTNNSQNLILIENLKDRDLIIRYEFVEKKNELRVIAKYQ